MSDEAILQSIEMSGRRAPNSPDERPGYYRLLDEGYIRRVPLRPTPGDTNDPLVCVLTEQGRKRLAEF
jgi:hypothetical protein